jgi:hypothetical protein
VISPRIASQATVNLARIDVNLFAALTDCLVHDAVKLVAEIIGG